MERWNQKLVDKYDDIMDKLYETIREILIEKIGKNIRLSFDDDVVTVKLEKVDDRSFTVKYKDISFNYDYKEIELYPFMEGHVTPLIRMEGDCDLTCVF